MRFGPSERFSSPLRFLLISASAALALTGAGRAWAGSAASQGGGSPRAAAADLGDVLFGAAPSDDRSGALPTVARFRADGESFILDVSTRGAALLKFDDSGEVWALTPIPGPRGDVIYKNDLGEPMLRATRLGGLTVFTQDRPGGMAAAVQGGAPLLRNLFVTGPIALWQVMARASVHASQAAKRHVEFDALDTTPGSEGVFADAANLVAQAFARADHSGKVSQAALSRYSKVAFLNGRPPGVRVVGEEVRVTVTPDMGFAGRPSSHRISSVIFRR